MPSIERSNTPSLVDTKFGVSNPKIDGKYRANSAYWRLLVNAPRNTVVVDEVSYGKIYNAQSGTLHGTPMSVSTNNRLYGKIKEEITGSQGELLTSSLEWKSSLDMITQRAAQIREAYLAVRRGKLKKAAKILRMSAPPKGRRHASTKQSATSLWLEYWMGWAPLIGDIGLAIDKLTKSNPPPLSSSVAVTQIINTVNDSLLILDKDMGAYVRHYEILSENGSFSAYWKAKVTNHNLMLANQLGFTNPVLTAWQMLPFSFMVDWFMNVGTVLSSLTDFAGVEITETGQAFAIRASGSAKIVRNEVEFYSAYEGQWPRSKRLVCKYDISAAYTTYHLRRTPGPLPVPQFQIVMLDKLSLTRAATSISLLVEIFLRKK